MLFSFLARHMEWLPDGWCPRVVVIDIDGTITDGKKHLSTDAIHAVRRLEDAGIPVVIATGDYRRQLESTPILNRPYRPLHVYGNTLRRLHYRGNPLPMPRFMSSRVLRRNRPNR